jgi:DNA-binding transcriptional LysR family regulator
MLPVSGGSNQSPLGADIVDFGIAGGDASDTESQTLVLMQDRMHAMYLAPHPLDKEKRITAEILASYPLILMDEDSTLRQVVDRAFCNNNLTVKPVISKRTSTAVRPLAALGDSFNAQFEMFGGACRPTEF